MLEKPASRERAGSLGRKTRVLHPAFKAAVAATGEKPDSNFSAEVMPCVENTHRLGHMCPAATLRKGAGTRAVCCSENLHLQRLLSGGRVAARGMGGDGHGETDEHG